MGISVNLFQMSLGLIFHGNQCQFIPNVSRSDIHGYQCQFIPNVCLIFHGNQCQFIPNVSRFDVSWELVSVYSKCL